jgi:PAS domain S-box-containing protein
MPLSRERLERLIARSTDIVVATDADGTVSFYNDGASRILGYASGETLGQYVSRLYPSLEEARRVMRAMRGEGHGGPGVCESFQTTFVSKSGDEIPVAITGAILYDDEGDEDGTIGFAKDLREILRKDQLATLGEVAIGLSHEINNPLAVVLNQTELLEIDIAELAGEGDISVEVERLDAIRREVARISEILERVGEMARGDEYATVEYIGPARMIDLRPREHGRHEPDPRMKGLRILVVDDDLGVCRSMSEMLEREGCLVETASDGNEALERLEQSRFDLVLSDVVMPGMDGYDLYRAVHQRFEDTPVLMMTAFHYDKDHIIKRSRIEGLRGVVFKKPVQRERLVAAILEAVGRA